MEASRGSVGEGPRRRRPAEPDDFDFQVDIHDVVANDEHVVGLVAAAVRVGDKEFSNRTAEIAHVEDGKLTERWAFSDDTEAIIDFFSQLG